MGKSVTPDFLKSFEKDLEKMEGIGTSALPPRYWYSTGNYVLNKIISGSFFKGIPQGRITDLAGASGAGKAQPLDARVLTPAGWTTMGELAVGDYVVGASGEPTQVLAIHPQGEIQTYTVTFADGSTTACCGNHLWTVWVGNNKRTNTVKKTLSTISIIQALERGDRVSIPVCQPIQHPHKNLDIDPYLLGVLLGDGCLTGPTPVVTTTDEEIVTNLKRCIEDDDNYIINHKNHSISYSIRQRNIVNRGGQLGCGENAYTTKLKQLKLWGARSHEKFIPDDYLTSSFNQRLKLVQGLMDTDGTVDKQGKISFSTSSPALATGMQQLLWSLGARCSIGVRDTSYRKDNIRVACKPSYTLSVSHPSPASLFTLTRKRERCRQEGDAKQLRRWLVSVTPRAVEPAQCITVDAPDHLYVTDDYIVTHNSFLAANLVKAAQAAGATVLVVDSENALDNEFMGKIGVDVNNGKYMYAEVTTIAQVTNVVSKFLKGYRASCGEDADAEQVLILIDSLDMLMTETEQENYEKGVQKGDQGQRNKQLKAMLRGFVQDIKTLNVAMICTSQVYKNQDVLNGEGVWIVSDAVKYACSQIVMLSKLKLREAVKGQTSKEITGINMKCEGYKTRFTKPFQVVNVEVPYETGMDPYSGLAEVLTTMGLIEKKSGRYYLDDGETWFFESDIGKYAEALLVKAEAQVQQYLTTKIGTAESDLEVDESEHNEEGSARSRRKKKATAE